MRWYDIKAKAEKAEIWIYEFIGKDFWSGEGLTAKDFQKELAQVKAPQIDLHVNSPGGDVFDGVTIHNLLKQHPANVTTYIDGLAASIASVIALAGDTVYMAENALFMLHQPWGFTMGNIEDHEKTVEVLKQIEGSIAKTYTAKTGKENSEILEMMRKETWLNADEAAEMGFVDEITDQMDLAACARFAPIMAKMKFRNTPESIRQTPTRKEAEKALRNAGFSRNQARDILAKGISDGLRNAAVDEDPEEAPEIQRKAEEEAPKQRKNDRVAELLTRAEILAPATA